MSRRRPAPGSSRSTLPPWCAASASSHASVTRPVPLVGARNHECSPPSSTGRPTARQNFRVLRSTALQPCSRRAALGGVVGMTRTLEGAGATSLGPDPAARCRLQCTSGRWPSSRGGTSTTSRPSCGSVRDRSTAPGWGGRGGSRREQRWGPVQGSARSPDRVASARALTGTVTGRPAPGGPGEGGTTRCFEACCPASWVVVVAAAPPGSAPDRPGVRPRTRPSVEGCAVSSAG